MLDVRHADERNLSTPRILGTVSQEFAWLDLTPMTAARESHSSRPIRAVCARILVVGGVAASLVGCSSASSVDGNYIKIAETSGISSAWIVEGDSIQFVNGSCGQCDLDHEPAVLSEDGTRITDPETGENYTLAWYDDRTGFVWEGHGDFIRDDSEIGKSAVERWEAACGMTWLR